MRITEILEKAFDPYNGVEPVVAVNEALSRIEELKKMIAENKVRSLKEVLEAL